MTAGSADSQSLEFVPMSDADLDAVLAIENDLYGFPWTRGNFSDALRAGYCGWLLRTGGELAGYAMVMIAMDEAHLLNISIAAPMQRRGYGARLMLHVIDSAERHGARSLLLEVRPSNAAALEMYRQFGFARIGLRRGYYPAAAGREDAIVLKRPVGERLA